MTCRSSTILVQILSDSLFLFLIGATLNRAGWHWRPLDFTGMQGCGAAGRVVLSDADIDAMEPQVWEQSLRRWTKRRPRPQP
jgi:hypothetical protein